MLASPYRFRGKLANPSELGTITFTFLHPVLRQCFVALNDAQARLQVSLELREIPLELFLTDRSVSMLGLGYSLHKGPLAIPIDVALVALMLPLILITDADVEQASLDLSGGSGVTDKNTR